MVYAPAVIIVLPGHRFTSDGMLDKGTCFLTSIFYKLG